MQHQASTSARSTASAFLRLPDTLTSWIQCAWDGYSVQAPAAQPGHSSRPSTPPPRLLQPPPAIPPAHQLPPRQIRPAPRPRSSSNHDPAPPHPAPPVPPRSKVPRPSPARLAEGGRRFGHAIWSPVTRLSSVLWLEFTGVFFGLFALSAGIGAWKLRSALHLPASDPAHTHFLLALGISLVFAYFCVSSFLRASRRGRRA